MRARLCLALLLTLWAAAPVSPVAFCFDEPDVLCGRNCKNLGCTEPAAASRACTSFAYNDGAGCVSVDPSSSCTCNGAF